MATFSTVGGLVTGLNTEANTIAVAVAAAVAALKPHVSIGNAHAASIYLELEDQVAALLLLGVDANDPIPGRSE